MVSLEAIHKPLERRAVLANSDFIVRRRRVVRPRLLWDDGLCNNLELVQVEDVFQRRPCSHSQLPLLFFLGDLLDDLGDGARIDGAETGRILLMGVDLIGTNNVLLVRGEIRGDSIRRVDGLICLAVR